MAKFTIRNSNNSYSCEKGGVISIGRALGNTIVFPDLSVSARHCEIVWDPARGAQIRDMGSLNATVIIRGGEKILVGQRKNIVANEVVEDMASVFIPLLNGDKIRLCKDQVLEVEYVIEGTRVESLKHLKQVCKEKAIDQEPLQEMTDESTIHLAATVKEEEPGIMYEEELIDLFEKLYSLQMLYTNGSTAVYKASPRNWTSEAEPIAIKILTLNDYACDQTAELLFEREAKIAPQLIHPNIIRTYKTGIRGKQRYIMMEYCAENNLADYKKDKGIRFMNEKDAIKIILQVLDGLYYFHHIAKVEYDDIFRRALKDNAKKLVHRDIKPKNILIRSIKDNGDLEVVISDFGLAKDSAMGGSSGITSSKDEIRATLEFAPSDQVQNPAMVNTGVDIWSTFALLFWLLTDETPRDMTGCEFDQIENKRQLRNVKDYFRNTPIRKIRTLRKNIFEELADMIDDILSYDQEAKEYSADEEQELIFRLENMLQCI